MNKGGQAANNTGFTVIETMIVLAVTASLFVIAATAISGKQAKTEFQVSIRDLQTRVQQVVNEVASGYYPTQTGFSCVASINGISPLIISNGGSAESQGAHNDCIFAGKAVVFNKSKLDVYSLVGAKEYSGNDVKNAKEARIAALAPTDSVANIPDATQSYTLQYDLSLVGVSYDSVPQSTVAGSYPVAFLSNFANYSTNAVAATATASQTVDLYGFASTASFAGLSGAQIAGAINNEYSQTGAYPSRQVVKLCFASGTTDQSVLLIIGGDSGTAVQTEIKNGANC